MGLGPIGKSLLPRIAVRDLDDQTVEDLDRWMKEKQVDRSAARALGALKRREKVKKAKEPKPRRHKHHCLCRQTEECCRCKGLACLKPKPRPRTKPTKGVIE